MNDWGVQTICTKAGENTFKRDLSLADTADLDAKNTVVTLWGNAAQDFQGQVGSVIVIRKALVQTFQETKKLSTTNALFLVSLKIFNCS